MIGLDPDEEEMIAERRLAYGQHHGKWRILVRCFREDDDDERLCRIADRDLPVLECPRDLQIRVAELGALDDLLQALNRAAEKRLNALRSRRRENKA